MFIFVFKQKTAYEMRISDWSSDVCASDLPLVLRSMIEGETGSKSLSALHFFGQREGLFIASEEGIEDRTIAAVRATDGELLCHLDIMKWARADQHRPGGLSAPERLF